MVRLKTLNKKYDDMGTAQDLHKNKLTLAAYNELGASLRHLEAAKTDRTIYEAVASWYARNGAQVTEKNGFYIINL